MDTDRAPGNHGGHRLPLRLLRPALPCAIEPQASGPGCRIIVLVIFTTKNTLFFLKIATFNLFSCDSSLKTQDGPAIYKDILEKAPHRSNKWPLFPKVVVFDSKICSHQEPEKMTGGFLFERGL
jgi:hypothetical protein